MIIDSTSAGPAFCDAAVPVRTKMPVPMMQPMPSAVRFQGPSERRSSPRSASACSASNDFLVKSPTAIRSVRLEPDLGLGPGERRRTDLTRRLPAVAGGRSDGRRRVQGEPIFGGRHARVLLEEAREVALI